MGKLALHPFAGPEGLDKYVQRLGGDDDMVDVCVVFGVVLLASAPVACTLWRVGWSTVLVFAVGP
jgi:hypothetical protein